MRAPILFSSAAAKEASSLRSQEKGELLSALEFLRAHGTFPTEIQRGGALRAFFIDLTSGIRPKRMIIVFRRLTRQELQAQGRTGADQGYIVYHIGVVDDPEAINQALALAEARLSPDLE